MASIRSNKYFGKWGAIGGGILGGIIGGGLGAGISKGLGNAGVRGFNPTIRPLSFVPSTGERIVANPNKTTTILGRWNPDMENIKPLMGADDFNVGTEFGRVTQNKGGYNFLDVPDPIFKAAGDNFFEGYNKPWLDQAITRGDDIVLTTKPASRFDIMTPDGTLKGSYARELEHLANQNYKPTNVSPSEWQTIRSWFGK